MKLHQIKPSVEATLPEANSNKSNFVYSIVAVLAMGIIALVVMIWLIPPDEISFVVFLALVGMVVHFSVTLILYKFARHRGYESDRQLFRRQFIYGFFVAVVVVLFLAAQSLFDFF